jgi:hypothetical protein
MGRGIHGDRILCFLFPRLMVLSITLYLKVNGVCNIKWNTRPQNGSFRLGAVASR